MKVQLFCRGAWLASVLGLSVLAGSYAGNAHANAEKASKAEVNDWFDPDKRSEDPLLMLVSLADQTIRVFSGDTLVTTSRISSGKKGHSTPTGVFSILEKRRRHHSNIYSRAPMPYMQRLTWSGVALHESNSVPDYPASHGCVRLPADFARHLYGFTQVGVHVIITDEEVAPVPIEHDVLFHPRPAEGTTPPDGMVSRAPHEEAQLDIHILDDTPGIEQVAATQRALRAGIDPATEEAAADPKPSIDPDANHDPVRILITRRTGRELVRDVQRILNELGFDAGEEDGWMGRTTSRAIISFQKSIEVQPTGALSMGLVRQLYTASGHGPFSAGHIYVRQNFKPLFDAPIGLADPQRPLGTFFLTALSDKENGQGIGWQYLGLDDQPKENVLSDLVVDGTTTPDIAATLDRLTIPDEVRQRIDALIVAGSSIAISDEGLSKETSPRGTDFVLVTKPAEED